MERVGRSVAPTWLRNGKRIGIQHRVGGAFCIDGGDLTNLISHPAVDTSAGLVEEWAKQALEMKSC